MAKMQGITGGLSGKMGSAVFRQSGGQTIVTQYQPIVKNPNSEGQQGQRAKFKLMSQLAAIMATAMGSFIIKVRAEGSRPSQRNAFVQKNFPLVSVVEDAEKIIADIPMEKLQLTSSSDFYGQIEVNATAPSTPDVNDGEIDAIVTLPPTGQSALGKSGKMVLVGYGNGGDKRKARVVRMVDVASIDNSIQFNFSQLPAGPYTILSYGMFEVTKGKVRVDYDNIHTPADEDFISTIIINKAVSEGSMALTETIGANITIPARA